MTDVRVPARELHRQRRLRFLLGAPRPLIGPQLGNFLYLLNLEAEAVRERPRDHILVSSAPQDIQQKVRLWDIM